MTLPRALIERIRGEAQILAIYRECKDMPPGEGVPSKQIAAAAFGFIEGAAFVLGLAAPELLAACGAMWGDE